MGSRRKVSTPLRHMPQHDFLWHCAHPISPTQSTNSSGVSRSFSYSSTLFNFLQRISSILSNVPSPDNGWRALRSSVCSEALSATRRWLYLQCHSCCPWGQLTHSQENSTSNTRPCSLFTPIDVIQTSQCF